MYARGVDHDSRLTGKINKTQDATRLVSKACSGQATAFTVNRVRLWDRRTNTKHRGFIKAHGLIPMFSGLSVRHRTVRPGYRTWCNRVICGTNSSITNTYRRDKAWMTVPHSCLYRVSCSVVRAWDIFCWMWSMLMPMVFRLAVTCGSILSRSNPRHMVSTVKDRAFRSAAVCSRTFFNACSRSLFTLSPPFQRMIVLYWSRWSQHASLKENTEFWKIVPNCGIFLLNENSWISRWQRHCSARACEIQLENNCPSLDYDWTLSPTR